MSKLNFDNLKLEYAKLWDSMHIRTEFIDDIEVSLSKLVANRKSYESIGLKLNIPWFFIGLIHGKECSYRLSRCLHNGQPWDKVTTLVPAGRGPFASFEESSIDAMLLHSLHEIKFWSIERCLYEFERWNGFGYRKYHPEVLTPYLWTHSFFYSAGGYESDGRWSNKHIAKNTGVAVLLRYALDKGIISLNEILREGSYQYDENFKPPILEVPRPVKLSLFARIGFLGRRLLSFFR